MSPAAMRFARSWRWVLVWAGLFWLAPCAQAQDDVPAPPSEPADCPPVATVPTTARMQALMQAARDRGFLWRLTKDGHDSWLFGTIHVARLEWDFLGPTVMDALRATDTLALELDPADPEMQKDIAGGLGAVRGPALPAPLALRLDRASRAECLPAVPFDSMAPEIRVMLLGTVIGRRDGIDPAYGIDAALSGLGHARKMTVVSLETPELQLKALTMTTDADSLAVVEQSIADIETGTARTQLAQLAQAWADGDLDALVRHTASPDPANPELERSVMRRTLDDRNPGLADGIDALHRDGKRVFAAVGSAHMDGPLGLPRQMAARGYRVERIVYPH